MKEKGKKETNKGLVPTVIGLVGKDLMKPLEKCLDFIETILAFFVGVICAISIVSFNRLGKKIKDKIYNRRSDGMQAGLFVGVMVFIAYLLLVLFNHAPLFKILIYTNLAGFLFFMKDYFENKVKTARKDINKKKDAKNKSKI